MSQAACPHYTTPTSPTTHSFDPTHVPPHQAHFTPMGHALFSTLLLHPPSKIGIRNSHPPSARDAARVLGSRSLRSLLWRETTSGRGCASYPGLKTAQQYYEDIMKIGKGLVFGLPKSKRSSCWQLRAGSFCEDSRVITYWRDPGKRKLCEDILLTCGILKRSIELEEKMSLVEFR